MKNLLARGRVIAALVFVVLIGSSVSAQLKTTGEAIELVDGRSVVVAVPAGRINVDLQYVEMPDPGQSLHAIVRDHLKNLVVGKPVLLQTTGLTRGKVTGKLMVDGIDVSQQLLRDGAAWHVPIETSGQSKQEFDAYAESAALARQEKRGVWSIAGLKPPSVIRAENEEVRRQAETAERQKNPVLVGVNQYRTDTRGSAGKPGPAVSARSQMDAWVDTLAFGENKGYGIHVYDDPNRRYRVVYSSPIMIDLKSKAGTEKLECRVMYITGTRPDGVAVNIYMVGFRSMSEAYRFSKVKTRLSAIVDGKALSFGDVLGGFRGQGMIGGGNVASDEIMFFAANKAALNSIAKAKRVELRINTYVGTLPFDGLGLFKQIAAAGD